jgi:hypothetical protein
VSAYKVRNNWYTGLIQNFAPGGAYVQAGKTTVLTPGEDILLIARIGVLREQHIGKIAWVGSHGIGLKFQKPVFAFGAKEMGKLRSRKVRWEASRSADVVGYRLYWSTRGAVNYDSEYLDVGMITEVTIPNEIPSFRMISGDIELGISAINQAGNESEMTKATVHLDFTVPQAPEKLVVDEL